MGVCVRELVWCVRERLCAGVISTVTVRNGSNSL